MSDQVVNSAKTSIFFSYNTLPNIRNSIFSSFSTSISTQFEKYLGLPPVVGRVKKRAFNEIKNRVFRRLQGWKEQLLSQAGQEVRICESIDGLHNGLRWQVGTGEKIKIWKDRWLSNPTTFKVVSPI